MYVLKWKLLRKQNKFSSCLHWYLCYSCITSSIIKNLKLILILMIMGLRSKCYNWCTTWFACSLIWVLDTLVWSSSCWAELTPSPLRSWDGQQTNWYIHFSYLVFQKGNQPKLSRYNLPNVSWNRFDDYKTNSTNR